MKYPLQSMLFVALVGVAVNAQALCMNPDGSLDDASVTKESLAVDTLPACEQQVAKDAGVPKAMIPSDKERAPVPAQPAAPAQTDGKRASVASDCQMANGMSQKGYIGAGELLPACVS